MYHPDPRQAKEIGELCRKHHCTIYLSTATFLRFCLRKCEPDDFRTLRILICGAEKLPLSLAQEFEQQIRRAADGRLRLHGAVAGGVRQLAGPGDGRRPPDRQQARHRRPTAAGRRRRIVHPDTRDAAAARRGGTAADPRRQRHEGLSWPAGADAPGRPGRLVRDRRHGAAGRGRLHHA